jgi:DNA replication protein DnaC
MTKPDPLRQRAQSLRLYGLLAHWSEVCDAPWLQPLLQWEEEERGRRSLERRRKDAHLGQFKALSDFDWQWPKRCDRSAVEALMTLEFLKEAANVVLIGQNGVGKTMIAKNIAYQALVQGHTVRFTSAGEMLGDLAAIEAIRCYGDACAATPHRTFYSSMRSAIFPTRTAMPTCSLSC